jgi:hypothetical protein
LNRARVAAGAKSVHIRSLLQKLPFFYSLLRFTNADFPSSDDYWLISLIAYFLQKPVPFEFGLMSGYR